MGSAVKTKNEKKKSKKEKKKSKKDTQKKSVSKKQDREDDALKKVSSPSEVDSPYGSNSPDGKQKLTRKISTESPFHISATRRRSRAASQLSITYTEDFWDRHFQGENRTPWREFRAAFLEDYGAFIQDFAPRRMHWILAIVHEDIFRNMDDIYRPHYEKFCKKYEGGDRLWPSVKEYASERIFREGVLESMFE